MLQSHPTQIISSPARLGFTNPNSPSLQIPPSNLRPPPPASSIPSTSITTAKVPSFALLSLLPPLSRAHSLLIQMASLTTRLFDVSSNRSSWIAFFRGSLPTFLPSQTLTLTDLPSSSKEILSQFTTLQTQLFEAVAELQEILDIQNAKQEIAREIQSKDLCLLSFAKKINQAQQILELLVDDYSDYRTPKRSKLNEVTTLNQDSFSSTHFTSNSLNLSDILAYAHRISYTTFAPPDFGAGQAPLRGALPPAPQDEQMRASQLYAFADLDVGLPKRVDIKDKAVDTLMDSTPNVELDATGVLVPPLSVPSGWRPGMPVELPGDIPIMPPGWKPGDPIPLPPMESIVVPNKMEVQRPLAPSINKPPEPIQVRFVQLDINPDQDEFSSDYSSEVGSSEEEDEE